MCVLQTHSFSIHKTLTDGLEWCGLLCDGLLWCFYQLFGLSFWRHPFTAEDPLVNKWYNATFLQIWWRNKLIYILDVMRVSTFSASFHFGWSILLTFTAHGICMHLTTLKMTANIILSGAKAIFMNKTSL